MPKSSRLLPISMLLDSLHLTCSPPAGMGKASLFLKEAFSVLVSIVKAKTMALRSKTGAARMRLALFRLLRNRKVVMSAISHRINALKGPQRGSEEEGGGAVALLPDNSGGFASEAEVIDEESDEEEEDERYPDLRHSLFDEDEAWGGCAGSAINAVRWCKEEQGEEFRLEDEIDQVADLFIRRFHWKLRLEKLEGM